MTELAPPPSVGKVSIVTPAYKVADCIGDTIQSVLDQTYTDWELLIADDCSPDRTREVVAEWAAKDARVRLIPMPRNAGPAAARNGALAAVSGRWIAFLDSDDLWLPRKLERQLAFQQAHDTAITFTGHRPIDETGRISGRYIEPPDWLDYDRALGWTGIATSTVILDRQRVGDIRMKSVYYDDYACWLEVLSKGGRGYGLDEDLMRYRVRAGSISRNKLKSAREVWRQLRTTEAQPLHRAAAAFASYALRAVLKYRKFSGPEPLSAASSERR